MSILAKVVLNKKEIIKDITNLGSKLMRYPPDFHVTCTYQRQVESDVEKEDVIDWCQHMISSGNSDIDITVEGIYEGMGTIFTKVVSSNPILPRLSSQILHVTLLVDYQGGNVPKNALLSLQNKNYKKIKSFNKSYKGKLVLSQ